MAYFLHKLTGPRATFPHDMTSAEAQLMKQHSDYWTALVIKGSAIAVGPVMDPAGTWGLALVEAPQETDAKFLANEDPLIKAEVGFRYDIFPVPQIILRK